VTALLAYLRQPTSIAGISAIVGTLMGLLSGNMTWESAAPLLVGAMVAIILPDNTSAKVAAATLVKDAIAAQRSFATGEPNLTIVSSGTNTL
jgi:hypothetical protein